MSHDECPEQATHHHHHQQQQSCSAGVTAMGMFEEHCEEPAAAAAVTAPLPAAVYVVYEDRQSVAAGVILVTAGLLSVVITAVGVGVYNLFSFLAHGIWFGVVVSEKLALLLTASLRCEPPPPSALNVTLPAFAAERRQLSIDISYQQGTQLYSAYMYMLWPCAVSVTSRCFTKRLNIGSQTKSHDSPGTQIFLCQRSPRNSTGVNPCGWGRQMQVVGLKSATVSLYN